MNNENNDFDARLTTKLARLDAAVPAPRQPLRGAATAIGHRRTRGRVILVLAAAALLTAASVFVATGTQTPRTPAEIAKDDADEVRVFADLGALTSDRCLSLAQATKLFREHLDALGLQGWSLHILHDQVREARCVGAAPIGADHEVVILPSMGGDVDKALDRVAGDLMTRCVTPKEAVALVRSTLVGLGRTDANVQVRPAWAFPADDGGAFVKHMAQGCAVYGGAQFDNAGRYTWFVNTH
jgi:hypothetical protein